jgi:hypothetical protein
VKTGGRALRRLRIVLFLVVGVLIVTIVSVTSAFAQGIPSEGEFPPGQGPSFNAVGGLENADANAKAKGKKDVDK